MKLNDQKCKNAKPKEKAYKLSDGGGLFLFVTSKGNKLWRMKYRFLGKEKKLSFGEYPALTLAEAREKRDEAKKFLAKDIDPSVVKKEEKQERAKDAGNTFEIIAREWHERKKSELSKDYATTMIGRLERDVFPAIGKMPIKSITHKMILDLAGTVQERGAHDLAKRIVQMCKNIFQYAIVTGRAVLNIPADLTGMVKSAPTQHYAAIESKDIPQFMTDLRNHKAKLNRQTYLAVNFMMMTFLRTGELIGAKWGEFDFENNVWLVPASRMKMKKEHIVPLSHQAIDVLQELRGLHNHPVYVFPSRISHQNHMSNNTILMALKRMGYKGKMTGHGFRSLALSTIMEKLNYRHEVPDLQLAHGKRGDVNKAYDRAKFLPERATMMQDWSDYLDNIAQGGRVIVGEFGKTA